ncbi:MAG: hypothetical protein ABIA02_00010 [Candidatus Falkowbacteria bacterium]
MKTIRTVFCLVCCIFLLNGCIGLGVSTIGLVVDVVHALPSAKSTEVETKVDKVSRNEIGRLVEEHEIGKNTVAVHVGTSKSRSGYIFIAYGSNSQIVSRLFYCSTREKDMRKYNEFLKMNSDEKKKFIHKDFLEFANVDLAVDAVTGASPPLSQASPPVKISTVSEVVSH